MFLSGPSLPPDTSIVYFVTAIRWLSSPPVVTLLRVGCRWSCYPSSGSIAFASVCVCVISMLFDILELSESWEVDRVWFWGSNHTTCWISDFNWNSIVSIAKLCSVFNCNFELWSFHVVKILLSVFNCLVDCVWCWKYDEKGKVCIITMACIVVVHSESDSLRSERSSHDRLEGSSIVVELIDLETWSDLRFYLSKVKFFFHANCGNTAVE